MNIPFYSPAYDIIRFAFLGQNAIQTRIEIFRPAGLSDILSAQIDQGDKTA